MADCRECSGRGRVIVSYIGGGGGCSERRPKPVFETCPRCKGTGQEPGCLVSTTVCLALNKPHDCNELTVLRSFRDEYLLRTHRGRQLVEEYYKTAPMLVEKLMVKSKTDPDVFWHLYADHILPIVNAIEDEDFEGAISRYHSTLAALRQDLGEE